MISSDDFQENFTTIREIDKGSYATIYQVKCIKSMEEDQHQFIPEGQMIAMKSMNTKRVASARKTWLKESYLLKQLDHPQIVEFYDSMKIFWEGQARFCLLMEYIEGQTLEKYVLAHDQGKIQSNPELEFIADRLLKGVSYLNSQGIVHRDLKPPNVLYSKISGLVKIIDFGLSGFFRITAERYDQREAHSYLIDPKSYGGTPLYMSPEVLNRELKDTLGWAMTDVWSLGIFCYFMASGKEPFDAPNLNTYKKVVKEGKYLKLTEPVSVRIRQLIERTLVVDVVARSTIQQLCDYWEDSRFINNNLISNR